MTSTNKARYDFLTDLAALLTEYNATINVDVMYHETILSFDIKLKEALSYSNIIKDNLLGATEIDSEDILEARNRITRDLQS